MIRFYKGAIYKINIKVIEKEYILTTKIYYRLELFKIITIDKEYNTVKYTMKMVDEINKEIINNLNGLFRL